MPRGARWTMPGPAGADGTSRVGRSELVPLVPPAEGGTDHGAIFPAPRPRRMPPLVVAPVTAADAPRQGTRPPFSHDSVGCSASALVDSGSTVQGRCKPVETSVQAPPSGSAQGTTCTPPS